MESPMKIMKLRMLDWELASYGLEGQPLHFNFYTSSIDLRNVPGFPAITDETTQFIVAWCNQDY